MVGKEALKQLRVMDKLFNFLKHLVFFAGFCGAVYFTTKNIVVDKVEKICHEVVDSRFKSSHLQKDMLMIRKEVASLNERVAILIMISLENAPKGTYDKAKEKYDKIMNGKK